MTAAETDPKAVEEALVQLQNETLGKLFIEYPPALLAVERYIQGVRAIFSSSSKGDVLPDIVSGEREASDLTKRDLQDFVARLIAWAKDGAKRQTKDRKRFLLVYYAYYVFKSTKKVIDLRPYLHEHVSRSVRKELDKALDSGITNVDSKSVKVRGRLLAKEFQESSGLTDAERARWAPLLQVMITFGVGGALIAAGTSSASAATSQVGTESAERSLSSLLRRIATRWKALTVIAIIVALVLLGWCIPSDDESDQGDQVSGVTLAQPDGTIALQEGANAPLDATTDAYAEVSYTADTDCAALDHEYRKRACYLSRGSSLAKTNLEEALTAFTAGLRVPRWRDNSIPELAAERWNNSGDYIFEIQERSFHTSISSIYCRRSQFKECRDAYRRAFDVARKVPQKSLTLMMSADECFIMVSLERKIAGVHAAAQARKECVSNYPGDNRNPFWYESGLALAATGDDIHAADHFIHQLLWSHVIFLPTKQPELSESFPGISEDETTVKSQSVRQLDAAVERLAPKGQGMRLQDAWIIMSDTGVTIMPFPANPDKHERCSRWGENDWRIVVTSDEYKEDRSQLPITIGNERIHGTVRIEAEHARPLPCWREGFRHAFCVRDGKLKVDGDCSAP